MDNASILDKQNVENVGFAKKNTKNMSDFDKQNTKTKNAKSTENSRNGDIKAPIKSGFISLIGRTNVGKSSIINALIGHKLALTSHKQNATRRRLNAIVMHDGNQLIFIDTPGLHKSEKNFNKKLIESSLKSLAECDLAVFVASIFDDLGDYEEFLRLCKVPHIVLLNKVDLATPQQILQKLALYSPYSKHFRALLPFSCKKKSYQKPLLDEIIKQMPEHPYFYEPEFLTNTAEKELFRDFILEALFENFSDELPYNCEILIERVSEKREFLDISAFIITSSASHKGILIGKNGKALARMGFEARKKIENFTGKKVVLKLFVNVKKNWQNDDEFLQKAVFNA